MRSEPNSLEAISYSVALRASDSWEMALDLMSSMPLAAVMPDKVVYGAAVSAVGENLPLALRRCEWLIKVVMVYLTMVHG